MVDETGKEGSAATYRYHAVRIALFVAACVCVVLGVLMLTLSGDRQLRAEEVAGEAMRSEPQASVLLVMSRDDSDPLAPLARRGVASIMNSSAVSLDVEYLEAPAGLAGGLARAAQSEALAGRLDSGAGSDPADPGSGSGGPYDAVICYGDEALALVEELRSGSLAAPDASAVADALADTPVVFFGVGDRARARAAFDDGYATGLVEQGDVEGIIALAARLRPDAARLVAVVDDTPSGAGDRARFAEAASGMGAGVEFIDASSLTREMLARRIGDIGDDAIVFFLDASDDVSGNAYTRDESARFVADASSQPVFGIASGGVGEGIVGAAFTDPEADGQRAAMTCIDVLNGTSPAEIGLVDDAAGGFVFDAQAMARHGISADGLPADAVVVNQPAFSWESVAAMAPAIGLIVLGLVLIIAFALLGYRHSVRNMREIIAQSKDLEHRFHHDQLTEKPNMQWFESFLSDPRNASRVESLVGVDFVDFGAINDSYGRAVGDAVLCEFAERFDGVEGKEFLVRSTGSEFLFGFSRPIGAGSPELQAIEQLVGQPVALADGDAIDVDAHIGVANRRDAASLDEMVIGVDLAVRESKVSGAANAPMFYSGAMKHATEEKIGITAALKQAVNDESLVVLYQPQVDVRTNEVCGYEALARLADDIYRPAQFIPVAEMSGLVIGVDRVITKKVVQQLARWRDEGRRLVPVSVNYSAVQLKDEGYLDFLLGLLEAYGVDPSFIKIEITESLLLGDEDSVRELFDGLKAAGIPIALDDFGTGYTSLSWVASMPAQIVKLDKSLVDDYAVPGKERFLENLVRLVHDLGKTLVVEGVETPEQLQVCRSLGCDIVQGYYYSRPLLPDVAAQFVPPQS